MGLLNTVSTTAPSLPSRLYMYAQEKFGKSSFAANAPKPIFIMTEGETGLLSLMEAGRVPEVAHFPDDARSWSQLLDYVWAILEEPHDYRTLVIDTSNGAERLLSKDVLETMFGGQMTGKEGYASYGKGDLACIPKWAEFLRLLDDVRIKRKMGVILLAHSKIKTVNNPEGSDYDQLRPEGNDKLWTLTHKWADVIAAGTYDVYVKDDKAKGGKGRLIRTCNSVAVVAGNRYGLPETIPCGDNAKTAWANFAKAMQAAKAAGKKQPANTPPSQTPPSNDPPKNDGGTTVPSGTPTSTPPTPSSAATSTPPLATNATSTPAPTSQPPAPADEDHGDAWEPPTDEPAFNRKIPDAIARTIVGQMNSIELTWPTLRPLLPSIFGAMPSREITHITDLYLEEAEQLNQWLKTQQKPSKKREKVNA